MKRHLVQRQALSTTKALLAAACLRRNFHCCFTIIVPTVKPSSMLPLFATTAGIGNHSREPLHHGNTDDSKKYSQLYFIATKF